MILTAGMSLQIVQGAGAADCDVHVDFVDWTTVSTQAGASIVQATAPGMERSQTNGTNDVTVCSAPAPNPVREVLRIAIHNTSGNDRTLTIKTDNGSTERVIWVGTATTAKSIFWEKGTQWQLNV